MSRYLSAQRKSACVVCLVQGLGRTSRQTDLNKPPACTWTHSGQTSEGLSSAHDDQQGMIKCRFSMLPHIFLLTSTKPHFVCATLPHASMKAPEQKLCMRSMCRLPSCICAQQDVDMLLVLLSQDLNVHIIAYAALVQITVKIRHVPACSNKPVIVQFSC